MGCWNGTCVLSGLAIRPSEEAVAVPVIQRGAYGEFGTLFPIFGAYDDYGGIEDIKEDISTNLLLDTVNKKLGMTAPERKPALTEEEDKLVHELSERSMVEGADALSEEEAKTFRELQLKSFSSCLETFEFLRVSNERDAKRNKEGKFDDVKGVIDALERGGLHPVLDIELNEFGKGSTWNTLTILLIHGKIWSSLEQAILNTPNMFTIYSYGISNKLLEKYGITDKGYKRATGQTIFDLEIDKLLESIYQTTTSDIVNSMDEMHSDKSNEEIGLVFKQLTELKNDKSKGTLTRRGCSYSEEEIKHIADGAFRHLCKPTSKRIYGALKESILRDHEYIRYSHIFLEEIAESISDKGIEEWRQTLRNVFVLKQMFNAMRKNFCLMSGAGSQSDEHQVVSAMARAVLEVTSERVADEDDEE